MLDARPRRETYRSSSRCSNRGSRASWSRPASRSRLLAAPGGLDPASLRRTVADRTPIGTATVAGRLPSARSMSPARPARPSTCRTGPCSSPARWSSTVRAPPLAGSDTERWVATLRRLEALGAGARRPRVRLVGRSRAGRSPARFLAELRRQVGYHVAQGRPLADLHDQVRTPRRPTSSGCPTTTRPPRTSTTSTAS